MEAIITITNDLYDNVMKYTHATDISEAVTIALKDWMLFHRIREMNNRLSDNSINISNRYSPRESKKYSFN